jgi:hypothetical protein
MCADEREAVLVLIDVVDRNLPAGIAMADVALRAVFAPVNVGMAILALLAYIREYKISVTVCAPHFDVHAAQGEARLFVFKLRDGANRFPALGRVAILAGNLQSSMRTVRLSIRRRRLFIPRG